MGSERIIYTVDEYIATLTFDRPPMNALTFKDLDAIIEIITEANKDDNVRVIVITGAGDKAFCAGADVNVLMAEGRTPEFLEKHKEDLEYKGYEYVSWSPEDRLKEVVKRALMGGFPIHHIELLQSINTPTIAAVNGAASGLGCEIACACDMRIASERARFREPFVATQGAIPEIAMWLLPRLVGLAKAYELILTSDIIDAKEADKIGLVNKVVPHEQLMSATLELAAKLANKPPLAVKLAKEGIRWGLDIPSEKNKRWGSLAWELCMGTEDHREAVRAFLEKRKPVYKGK